MQEAHYICGGKNDCEGWNTDDADLTDTNG